MDTVKQNGTALEEKKVSKPPRGKLDMTNGPFIKKLILFAVPLILTGLLQSFYNAADLAVVGRFDGEIALAAVGSTGALTNLILGLFMGLSVGAGVMVAHQMGAMRYRAVERVVHNAVLIAAILGLVVGMIGFVGAPYFLRMMDTPDTVIKDATLYLRIIFCGVPASMLYNYCASMLRSTGDTKRPLIYLAISGLVNVALNLILVCFFSMGVAGVAIGTIASQYLSAAMILVYMHRTDGVMHFSFRKLGLRKNIMKQMLNIGIPSGIQGVLFSLSNVMIQSSINRFGDVVMAGNSAAANLEGFVYVAMNAMYQATLTFVGQNVGAKQYKNIKKVLFGSLLWVTVIGVASGCFILLFDDFFTGLYITDGAAKEAATTRLFLILPVYFMCGIMEVLGGALRGMGKSMTTMIKSLIGACALCIVWCNLIFVIFEEPKITHIYFSYPVSWLLVILLHIVFFVISYRKLAHPKNIEDRLS